MLDPVPSRSAASISGRSSCGSRPAEARLDSPRTCPSGAITVIRAPRVAASAAHSRSNATPAFHSSVSATSLASERRRSVRDASSRLSTKSSAQGSAIAAATAIAPSTGSTSCGARLPVQGVRIELVADPADGDDELRLGIVLFDVLAQAADVHVDRTRLHVYVATPHQVQQLEPVVDPMRMGHEELEQLELAEREARPLAVDRRLVGVEVDTQPPALEDLVREREVFSVGAAKDGTHARHQLPRRERLGDVVVGPELETEDAIDLLGPRGQHDDREGTGGGVGTQPPADFEPVGSGQHEIEQDERRALARDLPERRLPPVRLADGKALALEVEADQLADVPLVLDHQDRTFGSHKAREGIVPPECYEPVTCSSTRITEDIPQPGPEGNHPLRLDVTWGLGK